MSWVAPEIFKTLVDADAPEKDVKLTGAIVLNKWSEFKTRERERAPSDVSMSGGSSVEDDDDTIVGQADDLPPRTAFGIGTDPADGVIGILQNLVWSNLFSVEFDLEFVDQDEYRILFHAVKRFDPPVPVSNYWFVLMSGYYNGYRGDMPIDLLVRIPTDRTRMDEWTIASNVTDRPAHVLFGYVSAIFAMNVYKPRRAMREQYQQRVLLHRIVRGKLPNEPELFSFIAIVQPERVIDENPRRDTRLWIVSITVRHTKITIRNGVRGSMFNGTNAVIIVPFVDHGRTESFDETSNILIWSGGAEKRKVWRAIYLMEEIEAPKFKQVVPLTQEIVDNVLPQLASTADAYYRAKYSS